MAGLLHTQVNVPVLPPQKYPGLVEQTCPIVCPLEWIPCVCVCARACEYIVSAYVQKRTENSCTLYNTQLYVLTTLLAEALVDWPPDLECQLYPAQTDHPERFGIYMC